MCIHGVTLPTDALVLQNGGGIFVGFNSNCTITDNSSVSTNKATQVSYALQRSYLHMDVVLALNSKVSNVSGRWSVWRKKCYCYFGREKLAQQQRGTKGVLFTQVPHQNTCTRVRMRVRVRV